MTSTALIIKMIARINIETPDYGVMPLSGVFRLGRNNHRPASMISAYRLFQPTIASNITHNSPPVSDSVLVIIYSLLACITDKS